MIYLHRLLEAFLLPPLPNLLAILLGLVLLARCPRVARWLIGLGAVSLWLASMPALVFSLTGWMTSLYPPVSDDALENARVIVVLGAGRRRHAIEYDGSGGDTASHQVMERLRYAAWLHHRTGLPVVVSGGRVRGNEARSEAALMAEFLRELGVTAVELEGRSRTTWENAVRTAELLRARGIREGVVLVTHGLHMPRAVMSFRAQGLGVIPAPTVIASRWPELGLAAFLPQAGAMRAFAQLMHEWLGMLWYRLRHNA